jgi:hypothetical protein
MFPAIQGGDAPAPGYYVSTTTANTDEGLHDWDQRKYVDAVHIPYAAWAGWWHNHGVEQGDFGVAIRGTTGRASPFVFADSGSGRVGEISRFLFENLSPEREDEVSDYFFLVFPGSGAAVANLQKFRDANVITDQVRQILRSIDQIPAGDDNPVIEQIALFLALDADRARLARFRTERVPEAEFRDDNFRYMAVLNALHGRNFYF